MNMERIEEKGRRMWFAAAMNQIQSEATVGASSERRCQRSRGDRWLVGGGLGVAAGAG
jgi:hypothetical protein